MIVFVVLIEAIAVVAEAIIVVESEGIFYVVIEDIVVVKTEAIAVVTEVIVVVARWNLMPNWVFHSY